MDHALADRRRSPETLTEILDFRAVVMDDLRHVDCGDGRSYLDNMHQMLKNGVVLTSTYSGLGSAELAASLLSAACDHGGGKGFKFHSACDFAKGPRCALMSHVEASAPLHVFGDVLDRLPQGARHAVVGILNRKMRQWRSTCRQHGKSSVTATLLKKKLGQSLLREVCAILNVTEFVSEAWCYKHGHMCPVDPRLDPESSDLVWMEVAGTVCKPWSQMGSQGEWLDMTSVACLTWLFSMRYYQPSMILHECTPSFKIQQLFKLLRQGSMLSPLCPFSEPRWKMKTEKLCPTDFGIPTRRQRRYSYLWASSGLQMRCGMTVKDIFGRELSVSGDQYFVADDEQVQLRTRTLAELHGVMIDDADLPQSVALLPAHWVRMCDYRLIAAARGIHLNVSSPECPGMAIVNLGQNPSRSPVVDDFVAPTLLTGSKLFDLVRSRLLEVDRSHLRFSHSC
jgi:hypothetical protein